MCQMSRDIGPVRVGVVVFPMKAHQAVVATEKSHHARAGPARWRGGVRPPPQGVKHTIFHFSQQTLPTWQGPVQHHSTEPQPTLFPHPVRCFVKTRISHVFIPAPPLETRGDFGCNATQPVVKSCLVSFHMWTLCDTDNTGTHKQFHVLVFGHLLWRVSWRAFRRTRKSLLFECVVLF